MIQNRRLREPCLPQSSALDDDSQGHLVYKDGDILQARCTQNFSPTSDALRHMTVDVVVFFRFGEHASTVHLSDVTGL